MRKLFLSLALTALLFSCHSDETKNKEVKTDSVAMKKVDTSNVTKKDTAAIISTTPLNIKDFEVPKEEALEMIKWYKACNPSDRHDESTMYEDTAVTNAIKKANPSSALKWVEARFRDKDDEALYCRTRGNDSANGSSKVKNYKAMLMQLTYRNVNTYYLPIKLCPPPTIGCNPIHMSRLEMLSNGTPPPITRNRIR